MALEMLRNNHQGKIISACCVRFGKDLGYREVHDVVMKKAPNYKYIQLTTREGDPSKKRYLQDLVRSGELESILGSKLNPAKTHVYLCGNPAMIGAPFKHLETGVRTYPQPEGIIELLESRGFNADLGHGHAPGNIHFEEYWS
jgi:ferredoxin--NADP+ reductase